MLQPIFRIVGTKTEISLTDASVLLRGYLQSGCTRLVEPFCGSASVAFAVLPRKCLLADLQPHVVLTLRVLRSKPLTLMRAFDALRNRFLADPTPASFYSIRDNPPENAVDRAAWFVFVVHACFNWLWRVNQKGRCNTTFGGDAGIERVKRAMPLRAVLAASAYLDSDLIEIEHATATATIETCGDGDLIYVDPPYVGQFDQYNAKRFGNSGHVELHQALYKAWDRGSQIVIQCNANPELAALYQPFCLTLLRPVRRVVAGRHRAGVGANDYEMILVSQPRQTSLITNQRPEEHAWFGTAIRPTWNTQKKLWETWIHPQQQSFEHF